MDPIYKSIIEALIFASDESISSADIINAIKGIDGTDIDISAEDVEETVEQLNKEYLGDKRAFIIAKIANQAIFFPRHLFTTQR